MSNLSKAISLGRTILVAAIISATPALASTGGYDGHWNVQISSNRPSCPSGASGSTASAGRGPEQRHEAGQWYWPSRWRVGLGHLAW